MLINYIHTKIKVYCSELSKRFILTIVRWKIKKVNDIDRNYCDNLFF